MTENMQNAIDALAEAFKRDNEGVMLEDGESICGVFKDCVLIIGVEDSVLKINYQLNPYRFDDQAVFEE